MDKFIKVIGGAVLFSGMFIIAAPIGVGFGAIAGWTTHLFWEAPLRGFILAFKLPDLPLWQYGAAMGFFGSFLRTQVSHKAD